MPRLILDKKRRWNTDTGVYTEERNLHREFLNYCTMFGKPHIFLTPHILCVILNNLLEMISVSTVDI